MYRLANSQELENAEAAVRALRVMVNNNSTHNSVGPEAREQIRKFSTLMNSASLMVEAVRHDRFTPQAIQLVRIYDGLEKQCHRIVGDLSRNAEYDGPRRSKMTVSQKSRYVTENGADAYNALPY